MQNKSGAVASSTEPDMSVEYDRPRLVPIGNLHDLLMGASGVLCDAAGSQLDNLTATGSDCI